MLTGDGRTLTYTANNLLATAAKSNQEVEYYYGPDNQRFKRVDRDPSDNETTTFYSSSTEWIVHEDNTKEWKRSILGYAQITHEFNSGNSETSQSLHYLLKDHLGSITHIVDDATYGTLVASQEFDPWGNRRKAEDWTQVLPTVNIQSWFREAGPITGRGYTGHESMDEMGLIHMNGRVYDPKLGRMIQADPLIQAPYFSQSLNRYSYVWNNPMRFTDPSGYCATEPPDQSHPDEEDLLYKNKETDSYARQPYDPWVDAADYPFLFYPPSDSSGYGSGGGKPSNVNGKPPGGNTDTSCGRMCPKQLPNQKTNHKEQLQNIADVLGLISAALTAAGMIVPPLLPWAGGFGGAELIVDALAGSFDNVPETAATELGEKLVDKALDRIPGYGLLPRGTQRDIAGQIVAGPETVHNVIEAAQEVDESND